MKKETGLTLTKESIANEGIEIKVTQKEEIKCLKDKLVSLPKSEQMKILDTVETFDKWIEENL